MGDSHSCSAGRRLSLYHTLFHFSHGSRRRLTSGAQVANYYRLGLVKSLSRVRRKLVRSARTAKMIFLFLSSTFSFNAK